KMSEEVTKPQGKGMGVAGFVIALVGLLFATFVIAATVVNVGLGGGKGLLYFWLILCIGSVVLSVMGMMKLGKTGGKKGLAIAGLVVGIVATIWTGLGLATVSAAEGAGLNQLNNLENNADFQDMMNDLEELGNN
ncbi:MAG: hypothetical protein MK066_12935, partial [Crocinitomicaceae bacterium]|nr:hypothetical protein [Crocinitomicaceae bacterium]